MIGQSHPETNPITIKPKTASHASEQFSWVPLPSCSPPGCPFPIKSLALSACVSLDNSFPSVRQEPSFGPWKGSPFLQQNYQGSLPPTSGNHKSVVSVNFFFYIPHISEITQCLYFCVWHFIEHNPLKAHPCCCKWHDSSFKKKFLWTNSVCVCLSITSSLSIHLLMDT